MHIKEDGNRSLRVKDRQLARQLRRLTPRAFEHLSYDLLVLSGLRNAEWRTPGADAGRDIEGEYLTSDLSENLTLERWYVECKHYIAAVDWPTIYAKLAYAENHDADFLLLVTTGSVSPRAKEEIASRDRRHARPAVRVWDAAILENLVLRHPFLLQKHGLSAGSVAQPPTANALVRLVSKSIQAAYGHELLKDTHSSSLEFAAALVDLLAAREAGSGGGWSPFRRDRDSYTWLRITTDHATSQLDCYGLRAVVTAVRFYLDMAQVTLQPVPNGGWAIPIDSAPKSAALNEALHAIALATNLETRLLPNQVRLSSRH